jgi:hypothetical protein
MSDRPAERSRLARLLVPETERQLPGLRWIRMTMRTAHIATFSVVIGGHIFAVPADRIYPWLLAAIATGAGLIALSLYQSFLWLREVRGVAILIKLGLLCAIPLWWEARVPILFAIVVISSYVSHMPGRYRYWVIGRGPRKRNPKGARG